MPVRHPVAARTGLRTGRPTHALGLGCVDCHGNVYRPGGGEFVGNPLRAVNLQECGGPVGGGLVKRSTRAGHLRAPGAAAANGTTIARLRAA